MTIAEDDLGLADELDVIQRGRRRGKHPLVRFVLRRVAAGSALLTVASILIFLGTEVLPGDAANAILGRNASPEALAAVRAELGLDRPAYERYFEWLAGFVSGDLGESVTAHQSVASLISERIVNTLVLAAGTIVLMLPIAIGLGILAGTRPGRPIDHVVSSVSLGLIAVPEFVTGTLLALIFAVELRLFPPVSVVPTGASPLDNPDILVLPIATLLLVGLAYITRMVRAGVSDVMASDYVETARLNGVPEWRIILRHALPNALAPTVQVIALTLQWLIGGIFVVETVFGYPGIGQGLVQAVIARDIPLIQSVAMLIAIAYVVINIAADLIVVLLIPKLRTTQ